MEVMHPRCAGIDVSKRDAKVCIRIQGSGGRRTSSLVTTWGSMTNQIRALRDHLAAQLVTVVVMEATGDYWRPFYYLLEADFEVMLVNAGSVRNVPGRKSDVSDAAWLADLGAHGLVRASFVPPEPIRQLRDLTRARTHITRERTREIQRLKKQLEDALLTELRGGRFVSCGEIPRRVVSVRCHGRSSGYSAGSVVVGGAVSGVA
jgi:transposase